MSGQCVRRPTLNRQAVSVDTGNNHGVNDFAHDSKGVYRGHCDSVTIHLLNTLASENERIADPLRSFSKA
ncbi:hypothetical protein OHV31_00290 [Acinetobacter baumannii]|nr:hypothetical protein [Acinetobacter baumannii]